MKSVESVGGIGSTKCHLMIAERVTGLGSCRVIVCGVRMVAE